MQQVVRDRYRLAVTCRPCGGSPRRSRLVPPPHHAASRPGSRRARSSCGRSRRKAAAGPPSAPPATVRAGPTVPSSSPLHRSSTSASRTLVSSLRISRCPGLRCGPSLGSRAKCSSSSRELERDAARVGLVEQQQVDHGRGQRRHQIARAVGHEAVAQLEQQPQAAVVLGCGGLAAPARGSARPAGTSARCAGRSRESARRNCGSCSRLRCR